MKRFLSSLMLTSLFWGTFYLNQSTLPPTAPAQTSSELSYRFYGKTIP